MNFRDYYYLGEVILGLRIEYRRINQELEALKEDVKKDVKIKQILTHEQYMQNCYTVERR